MGFLSPAFLAALAQIMLVNIVLSGDNGALGIGSIGSICGPLIGAALLSFHWEMRHVFLMAAISPVIASAAALMLARTHGSGGVQAVAA
jgi:AAHS family 4-hydroxybenzoate transporter-like MFS transporter